MPQSTGGFREGQWVRVCRMPEPLQDDPEMRTAELFTLCLGRVFPIAHISRGLLGLDVGALRGKPASMETIYIEPACVELAERHQA